MQHSFYSHAPRGARQSVGRRIRKTIRFYSHAPRGARQILIARKRAGLVFLLTRPSRGATANRQAAAVMREFLLTRPSRGATSFAIRICDRHGVSTHTPLAGRDRIMLRFICSHTTTNRGGQNLQDITS